MFYEIRNNFVDIDIPIILVESIKHNCHFDHIQSLDYTFKCQSFLEIFSFGKSFLTIWQLNHIFCHFMLQLFNGSHPYVVVASRHMSLVPGLNFYYDFLILFCSCYSYFLFVVLIFFVVVLV